MDIQFDIAKDAANIAKHGVSLACAADLDWSVAVTVVDDRTDYSEERFVVFAPLNGRVYVAVYVMRNGAHRFISLRKANNREKAFYESQA